MTHNPPPGVVRRTGFKALAAGLATYVLVKMAGVSIMTGFGPWEIAQAPELFLPAAGSRALSELIGAGLILLFTLGFARITPRSGFLAVALVQMAIGWWAPASMQDTWIRWLFGASGLNDLWAQMGLQQPFQHDRDLLGGLSTADILGCLAAGVIAQTLHNLTQKRVLEKTFQSPPPGSI